MIDMNEIKYVLDMAYMKDYKYKPSSSTENHIFHTSQRIGDNINRLNELMEIIRPILKPSDYDYIKDYFTGVLHNQSMESYSTSTRVLNKFFKSCDDQVVKPVKDIIKDLFTCQFAVIPSEFVEYCDKYFIKADKSFNNMNSTYILYYKALHDYSMNVTARYLGVKIIDMLNECNYNINTNNINFIEHNEIEKLNHLMKCGFMLNDPDINEHIQLILLWSGSIPNRPESADLKNKLIKKYSRNRLEIMDNIFIVNNSSLRSGNCYGTRDGHSLYVDNCGNLNPLLLNDNTNDRFNKIIHLYELTDLIYYKVGDDFYKISNNEKWGS